MKICLLCFGLSVLPSRLGKILASLNLEFCFESGDSLTEFLISSGVCFGFSCCDCCLAPVSHTVTCGFTPCLLSVQIRTRSLGSIRAVTYALKCLKFLLLRSSMLLMP